MGLWPPSRIQFSIPRLRAPLCPSTPLHLPPPPGLLGWRLVTSQPLIPPDWLVTYLHVNLHIHATFYLHIPRDSDGHMSHCLQGLLTGRPALSVKTEAWVRVLCHPSDPTLPVWSQLPDYFLIRPAL